MKNSIAAVLGIVIGLLLGMGLSHLGNRQTKESLATAAEQLAASKNHERSLTEANSRLVSDLAKANAGVAAERSAHEARLSEAQQTILNLKNQLSRAPSASSLPTRQARQATTPPPTSNRGDIAGGLFRYGDFSWKVDEFGMLRFQGAITNYSPDSWDEHYFQIAAHNDRGKLLAVTLFEVRNLAFGETKAFSGYFTDEIDWPKSFNFRITSEGGIEKRN
jgi:uncharacterized membrane-anchored protein YhcB (DUF1043 family)